MPASPQRAAVGLLSDLLHAATAAGVERRNVLEACGGSYMHMFAHSRTGIGGMRVAAPAPLAPVLSSPRITDNASKFSAHTPRMNACLKRSSTSLRAIVSRSSAALRQAQPQRQKVHHAYGARGQTHRVSASSSSSREMTSANFDASD